MSRLTNYTREAISSAAIKAAFTPRENDFSADEDALAREAYAAVYPADEVKKAMSLPENWLRRDPCLYFNVNGLLIELCTTDNHLPVPYRCHRSQGSIPEGDLAERITAHAMAKEALRDEKRSARIKLDAMLSSISTVKKLQEVWPEGAQFYAKFAEKPAALPPAIRVEDVNAALGLESAQ